MIILVGLFRTTHTFMVLINNSGNYSQSDFSEFHGRGLVGVQWAVFFSALTHCIAIFDLWSHGFLYWHLPRVHYICHWLFWLWLLRPDEDGHRISESWQRSVGEDGARLEQMCHAVETVANTSACGHVAVQFRQERTGRDDWGEREDWTNGTETEQHRSIKSTKMGLMKMMLLIPPPKL